jgi:hypothetical protein
MDTLTLLLDPTMERYSNTPLKQILASFSKNAANFNFNFNFAKYPPCIADVAEKAEKVCDDVTNYVNNKWSSNVSDWETLIAGEYSESQKGSSLDVALELADELQNRNHFTLKSADLRQLIAKFSFEHVTGIHPSPSGGMTNPSVSKEIFNGILTVEFSYAKDHLKFKVHCRLMGWGLNSRSKDSSTDVYRFIHGFENELSRFSTSTPSIIRLDDTPFGNIFGLDLYGTIKCRYGDLQSEISHPAFDSLFTSIGTNHWVYEKKDAFTFSDGDTADATISISLNSDSRWELVCDIGHPHYNKLMTNYDKKEIAKEKALELASLVEQGDLDPLSYRMERLRRNPHS